MKLSFRSSFCAAVAALLVIGLLAPCAAKADTYTLYNLGDDNGYYLDGITDSGSVVVVEESGGCPGAMETACYETYTGGQLVSRSVTAPAVTFDNGTPCDALPPGFGANGAVCNNGYVGFAATEVNGQQQNAAYAGPVGDPVVVGPGYADAEAMNANGDFVWVDARDEFFYEAVDTTTTPVPEPSGLVLLGTGLLSLAGMRRQRRG